MELYELLGLHKSATASQIKHAYRERSLVLHPDAGGGAERFTELVLAYEILSNPESRAQYDRDGIGDTGPEEQRTRILNVVARAFQHVMSGILKNDREPTAICLAQEMERSVEKERKKALSALDDIEEGAARLDEIARRFRRKKDDGENTLRGLVAAQADAMRRKLVPIRADLALLEGALVEIRAHDFDVTILQVIPVQQVRSFIPTTQNAPYWNPLEQQSSPRFPYRNPDFGWNR